MKGDEALVPDKRRMEKRYDCEAKIKWSYFNNGEIFDAKILNCSLNGNYFETPHVIKPGSTILIRLETLLSKCTRSDEPLCLRTISLAKVKWCNNRVEDGDLNFGVGVRHLDLK